MTRGSGPNGDRVTGALIDGVVEIVNEAAAAILRVYDTDFDVAAKSDESPITQADLAAHRVITRGLDRLTPGKPQVSEEGRLPALAERRTWEQFWLIDPLDGTREFVGRNGEFTVNVALIDGGVPVLGVVGVPVTGRAYVGDVAAGSAWRQVEGARETLRGRTMADQGLTVVASRSHGSDRLEAYIGAIAERFPNLTRRPVGSSLKLCILAEGGADLYPRLGPTSEWDIGAAHAVLVAAGGDIWCADGSAMKYNAREGFLNPEFIAVADAAYGWRERLPQVPPGGHAV